MTDRRTTANTPTDQPTDGKIGSLRRYSSSYIGVELGGEKGEVSLAEFLSLGHPNEIKGKIKKVCPEGGKNHAPGGEKSLRRGGGIFAPLTNFSHTGLSHNPDQLL